MGKKKKVSEQLKDFYRGAPAKPGKDADENDMVTISEALKSCLPKKDSIFKFDLKSETLYLQIHIGLQVGLRCLKQKRTWAILYDNTAQQYLQNYLNEFASKSGIPTLKAKGLLDLALKQKYKSMLMISLVICKCPAQGVNIVESQEFDKLCNLLLNAKTVNNQSTNFRLPTIEKIASKSKQKEKHRKRSVKTDANKIS